METRTYKMHVRVFLSRYREYLLCSQCRGQRLNPIALGYRVGGLDLAAWHVGIHMTKLGNATLFGNVSSFGFAAWGLWLARRWPSPLQAAALGLAEVAARDAGARMAGAVRRNVNELLRTAFSHT